MVCWRFHKSVWFHADWSWNKTIEYVQSKLLLTVLRMNSSTSRPNPRRTTCSLIRQNNRKSSLQPDENHQVNQIQSMASNRWKVWKFLEFTSATIKPPVNTPERQSLRARDRHMRSKSWNHMDWLGRLFMLSSKPPHWRSCCTVVKHGLASVWLLIGTG